MIGQFELYRLNPNINIVPTTPPNTQRPLLPSNSIMTPSNNNNNNKPQPPQPPTEQNGSTPSIQIIPTSKSAPSISKPIPINRPNVLLVPVRTPTTLNAPRNANTPIGKYSATFAILMNAKKEKRTLSHVESRTLFHI